MEPQPILSQQENMHKILFKTPSAPENLFKNPSGINCSLKGNHQIITICPQTLKIKNEIKTQQKRISVIKQFANFLATCSRDYHVNLWDIRSNTHIHKFQKPGAEFISLDCSQHIIAAGYRQNIVFWDLRKMKQRGQFRESFNGQITHIKFGSQKKTDMMVCALDGMINFFDLTKPNEDQAFSWGYRIQESPEWLDFRGEDTLIRTTDHSLITLHGEDCRGRLDFNNPEMPKHILYSRFGKQPECLVRNVNENMIEGYFGNKCVGYVNGVFDVQFLCPLDPEVRTVLFCSETGEFYAQKLSEQKQIFRGNDQQSPTGMINTSQSLIPQNSDDTYGSNVNGYIINRPSSFKSKGRKYQPY